jgi:hypothetical protein
MAELHGCFLFLRDRPRGLEDYLVATAWLADATSTLRSPQGFVDSTHNISTK